MLSGKRTGRAAIMTLAVLFAFGPAAHAAESGDADSASLSSEFQAALDAAPDGPGTALGQLRAAAAARHSIEINGGSDRTLADDESDLFSGGSGDLDDPYQITDCDELQNIGEVAEGYDAFILENDIDCSVTSGWNLGAGFEPIGSSTSPFQGVFDGNHKTIRNLYINRPDDNFGVGLFAVTEGSVIMNVNLAGGAVTGGGITGSLAGVTEYSVVGGVSSSGMTIAGMADDDDFIPSVGGLIGLAAIDVPSFASVQMSSAGNVVISTSSDSFQSLGGLIGTLTGASVADSYATSTVSGGAVNGGLIGIVLDGDFFGMSGEPTNIQNVYSSGAVGTGDDTASGGLIGGVIPGNVSVSYGFSVSSVTGEEGAVGGLVGTESLAGPDSFDASIIDHDSDFFDASTTGQVACIGGEEESSCIPVNTGELGDLTDGTYFLGNHINGPLPHFDTDDIWQINTGELPTLRPTFTFDFFGGEEITDVEAEPTDDGATITWTTENAADTQVQYGITGDYGAFTLVYDGDEPVTSHEATIGGLLSCTQYRFQVISNEDATAFFSEDQVFTTTGCTGGAEILHGNNDNFIAEDSEEDEHIGFDMGGDAGMFFTIPPGAAGANANFQFKQLESGAVMNALGLPSGRDISVVPLYVFDVRALTDDGTLISEFDPALTIRMRFDPESAEGYDQSSFFIARNDGDGWVPLDCEVDTDTSDVTCTTDHFSIYALFGSPAATGTPSRHVSHSGSGVVRGCKDPAATNYSEFAASDPSRCVYAAGVTASAAAVVTLPVRDLELGMTGEDVRALQQFLNAHGFPVALSGAGSIGNETPYFGSLTKAALAAYQAAHGIAPSAGYFGPKTRAFIAAPASA